jgi:hypothetical protein
VVEAVVVARRTHGYFEVFHALRVEDDESSPSAGGNF